MIEREREEGETERERGAERDRERLFFGFGLRGEDSLGLAADPKPEPHHPREGGEARAPKHAAGSRKPGGCSAEASQPSQAKWPVSSLEGPADGRGDIGG